MQPLIEMMLLAAAVDGQIDEPERFMILRNLAQHNEIPPISEGQISVIKQQLLDRLQQGHTSKSIIQSASQSLNEDRKILSYAMAVEVILSNNVLTESEVEHLKLHREILELDQKQVASIHFAARLRYGFGEFD